MNIKIVTLKMKIFKKLCGSFRKVNKKLMSFVSIRVQNYILGLRPWPRTLVGSRMNKQ